MSKSITEAKEGTVATGDLGIRVHAYVQYTPGYTSEHFSIKCHLDKSVQQEEPSCVCNIGIRGKLVKAIRCS